TLRDHAAEHSFEVPGARLNDRYVMASALLRHPADVLGEVPDHDASGSQCLAGSDAIASQQELIENDVRRGIQLRHRRSRDADDLSILDEAFRIEQPGDGTDLLRPL